jgi:hypothetical protein
MRIIHTTYRRDADDEWEWEQIDQVEGQREGDGASDHVAWEEVDDGETILHILNPKVEYFGRCEGCGCDLEEGDGLYCSGCDEAEAEVDDGPQR